MKTFDFKKRMNDAIKNKELVEINLHDAPTYKVAYILGAAEGFLLFAEVSSSATMTGVFLCQSEDVDSVCLDTIYTSELAKQIPGDSLYLQAAKSIENVKKYTFDGFISAFENTKTIVEVTTSDENSYAGRIVGHNDKTLVLDEYSSEIDRYVGHMYFNRSIVIRLSVDVPWLRTIARSLADKNL
jgi:hypothetical protein